MRRTAMAVVVGVLLLTALARAELAEIHRRREEVERERDQLRRELEALRAARESPPTPTPGPEEAAPRSATLVD
jgi:hypothetical protein